MATNRNRFRRFRGNQKLAKPVEAFYCACISGFTVIVEIVLIVLSVMSGGDNPTWMGSIGTCAAITALSCCIYNIKEMKKNTDVILKWSFMAISAITAVSWLVIFFVGVLN
ncbi:MAG: hypothetical protein HUJ71_05580 [Pseudobutyrivibrio sp.]|nr:hypothetical protein [Pseudobutyrivibrio sp.]